MHVELLQPLCGLRITCEVVYMWKCDLHCSLLSC